MFAMSPSAWQSVALVSSGVLALFLIRTALLKAKQYVDGLVPKPQVPVAPPPETEDLKKLLEGLIRVCGDLVSSTDRHTASVEKMQKLLFGSSNYSEMTDADVAKANRTYRIDQHMSRGMSRRGAEQEADHDAIYDELNYTQRSGS